MPVLRSRAIRTFNQRQIACRYEFETRVAQKCLQFESATVGDKQVVIVSGVRGALPYMLVRCSMRLKDCNIPEYQ